MKIADPTFADNTAKGLTPMVHSTPSSSVKHTHFFVLRFSGWDVQTPVSPKASSPPHLQATSSSIATSPGKFLPYPYQQPNVPYGQIHPNDDSALAVLTYAIGTFLTIERSCVVSSHPSIQSDHSQLRQSSSSATRTVAVHRQL